MYDKARRGMPEEVLEYLFSMITARPKILDLGCGTGIVTRQLKERGADVIGIDKDPEMLKKALAHETPDIQYIEAAAKDLPFEPETFDAVTAFSAFHWFATPESLSEIQRVLKRKGLFFIANRKVDPRTLTARQALLQSFATANLPAPKTYDYRKIFEDAGFQEVEEKKFELLERSSVEESVDYVQSTSYWNLVAESKHKDAKEALRKYFEGLAHDGVVTKTVWIVTWCGRKP